MWSFFGVASRWTRPGQSLIWASLGVGAYLEKPPLPELPERPLQAVQTGEDRHALTNASLIKQSALLSCESASKLCTHLYLAMEEHCASLDAIVTELVAIYEAAASPEVLALSETLSTHMAALQAEKARLRGLISELEIALAFAQKALDINAGISFLTGAEFASTKASGDLLFLENATSKLLEKVKANDEALIRAEAAHINKTRNNQPKS